jgi:glycyl-tRNA synthetase (class II)
VRDRDSMQQIRVAEDRLVALVDEKLHGGKPLG